jgi:hypothetical protein
MDWQRHVGGKAEFERLGLGGLKPSRSWIRWMTVTNVRAQFHSPDVPLQTLVTSVPSKPVVAKT